MRVYCKSEHHDIGGPGSFFLSHSEKALQDLVKSYGGKIQLIYLDPPFGTGDSFNRKDGKGDMGNMVVSIFQKH